MVLWNVLGLTNKHRTHEVAKNFFNGFQGLMYTSNFDTIKRKNSEDQILIQSLFKTMSKSFVFWPHKGGTSQKHFCAEISFLL